MELFLRSVQKYPIEQWLYLFMASVYAVCALLYGYAGDYEIVIFDSFMAFVFLLFVLLRMSQTKQELLFEFRLESQAFLFFILGIRIRSNPLSVRHLDRDFDRNFFRNGL